MRTPIKEMEKLKSLIRQMREQLNIPEPQSYDDLEELVETLEDNLRYYKQYHKCEDCNGTGGGGFSQEDSRGVTIDVMHECPRCEGKGYIREAL